MCLHLGKCSDVTAKWEELKPMHHIIWSDLGRKKNSENKHVSVPFSSFLPMFLPVVPRLCFWTLSTNRSLFKPSLDLAGWNVALNGKKKNALCCPLEHLDIQMADGFIMLLWFFFSCFICELLLPCSRRTADEVHADEPRREAANMQQKASQLKYLHPPPPHGSEIL